MAGTMLGDLHPPLVYLVMATAFLGAFTKWCKPMTTFSKAGLEAYITNPEAESVDGAWIHFPGGRSFLILRAGGSNEKFERVFQNNLKPYKRQSDAGTLPRETSNTIMYKTVAQSVLIDWQGIDNDDGQSVPYNPKVGVEFFEAFPEVYTELFAYATDRATFLQSRLEDTKEELGNS